MLAMCVRKTADSTHPVTGIMGAVQPGGTTVSSGSTSKRKHKPFKATKPRSSKEDRRVGKEKEDERVPSPKVQDDDDGHLIYRKGDVLESRCELATGYKACTTTWKRCIGAGG